VKHLSSTLVLILTLASAGALAQASKEHVVVANDPSLNAIVAPDARLEVLKGDYFGLLARPVWVRDGQAGYLLFSDVAANAIYKWTPDGTLSKFLDRSGYTGTQQGTVGAIVSNGQFSVVFNGSSGLMLDARGRLLIAATADRNVVRIEKNGMRTVLADRYDGKRFSSPIELAAKSDGALYITDGTAGLRNRTNDPTLEIPFEGVYLLKDGKVTLLDNDRKSLPSGITLTPDERTLVVGSNKKIIAYDIRPDDTIANPRTIVDWTDNKEGGWGPRIGVVHDKNGNLFATGPGGIWIIGPDGKHLGTIRMPEGVVSLAFGDNDGRGLYLAGRRSLYRVRIKTPGMMP
jgi:gluconolactonase